MLISKKLAKIEGYILGLCTLIEPFEASCRDTENFVSSSSSEEEQKACFFVCVFFLLLLLKCFVTIPESSHYSNDLDLRFGYFFFFFLLTHLFSLNGVLAFGGIYRMDSR